MKKYKITFSFSKEDSIFDFRELEDPEKFLQDLRFEGTYILKRNREKEDYHIINLHQVKRIQVVEYNPDQPRQVKAF